MTSASPLSTKHVVLGLLVERPGYGYDLGQRMKERVGFLRLSESGVYRALERLQREGLVSDEGARQSGATQLRRPFTVTDEGVQEFRAWMRDSSAPMLLREVLHAKLALSGPDDVPQLIQQVVEQEQVCLAELAALRRRPAVDLSQHAGAIEWPTVAALLVDDALARHLQANVSWLQQVRMVLEQSNVPRGTRQRS